MIILISGLEIIIIKSYEFSRWEILLQTHQAK
jgi:hypothetical protein